MFIFLNKQIHMLWRMQGCVHVYILLDILISACKGNVSQCWLLCIYAVYTDVLCRWVSVVFTSVMHGSSGVTSTGPSLKGGWAPCFIGLRCLILRLSTSHTNAYKHKKLFYTCKDFCLFPDTKVIVTLTIPGQTIKYKGKLFLMILG